MNYRNLLCLALGLPETAEDLRITMRLAELAGGRAEQPADLKIEKIKAYSAALAYGRDQLDAEVARQMGNSPAMILKYGGMTHA